ncbi:MAG TPA: orotidine-5'-phosphate decarboxylase, partial [bacterium]|nr:orotidine-5'-phosphate decarboxylase [bacterium]
MKWERKTGIVLALDVPDRERAFSLLDEVADFIDVIKFNYPLILREGLRIVTDIKRRYRKPILADFKVADVPVTNDRIVRLAAEAGADGIMVHGFIGIDALRSARRAAGTMKVLVVTQLTNPGGLDFTSRFTDEFAGPKKTSHVVAAGIQEMAENAVDSAHFRYVHNVAEVPEIKALEAACVDSGLSAARLLLACGALASSYDFHYNRFLFEHFPEGTAFPAIDVPVLPTALPRAEVAAFSIDDASTTEIDDAFSV